MAKIAAREQELADLLARVAAARQQPDEALAETLLREAERISREDADEQLRTLPLAPPGSGHAPPVTGRSVQVFWERGAGHDESTVYVVAAPRAARRPPSPTARRFTGARGPSAPTRRAGRRSRSSTACSPWRDGRPPSGPAPSRR